MNNNEKSLTTSGITTPHMALISIALVIVGITLYLTKHYFEIHYPTGLNSFGMCDLSSFWNCSGSTYSAWSSIWGIPTSIFGMLFGIFLLAGSVFPSKEFESTNYLIAIVNAIGCVAFFLYSIFSLGTLCPFCTLYYFLSFVVLYLFKKYGTGPGISGWKVPAIILSITIVIAGMAKNTVIKEDQKIVQMKNLLINQFYNLPNPGNPTIPSPHHLTLAKDSFGQAPIQVSIFSDFQCPACKNLSETTEDMVKDYQGNIDIQYYYFPLDITCNKTMKNQLHPYACQAAYLTTCVAKEKFAEVHDHIFRNQGSLSPGWLENLANEHGVKECMNSPETKKKVMDLVAVGESLKVESTPTIIINGRRINGGMPQKHFYMIFEEILKRAGK